MLGLLGGAAVDSVTPQHHGAIAIDTDGRGVLEVGRERVKGQRCEAYRLGRQVLPSQIAHHAIAGVLTVFGRKPHIGRNVVAPVAGVAGDSRLGHVRFPVLVDALRHLDHAPGHHLGVLGVLRKVLHVVAIGAARVRRHPLGDRRHVAVELRHAQVAKHLDIFVNVFGFGAVGTRGLGRHRCLVQRRLLQQGAGVVDLLHAGATKAGLHRINGRALAATEQRRSRWHQGGE